MISDMIDVICCQDGERAVRENAMNRAGIVICVNELSESIFRNVVFSKCEGVVIDDEFRDG